MVRAALPRPFSSAAFLSPSAPAPLTVSRPLPSLRGRLAKDGRARPAPLRGRNKLSSGGRRSELPARRGTRGRTECGRPPFHTGNAGPDGWPAKGAAHGRQPVWGPGAAGPHDAVSEYARPPCRRDGRTAAVYDCPEPGVEPGHSLLPPLDGNRRQTPWAPGGGHLFRGSAKSYAARPSVIAGPPDDNAGDPGVINVPDNPDIDVIDGAVIVEPPASPVAAVISVAGITETVVYSAVEADQRPPVALMPDIKAVAPSPVPGGPERAGKGSRHPCARHPVVAEIRIPGPISRRPNIAGSGAKGLDVNGDGRRGYSDIHAGGNLR